MRGEEIMSRTVAERCGLADTMSHLEQENCEQQRQLLMIQTQLAQAEQGHSQRYVQLYILNTDTLHNVFSTI